MNYVEIDWDPWGFFAPFLAPAKLELIEPLPTPPIASSPAVRATMQGNRRRDTKPEKELRSALFALGRRFRVDHSIRVGEKARPIRPDVIFPSAKLAIFVDGCFWHRCPAHGTRPSRNSEYWDAKLQRNVDRDRRYDAMLSEAGWTVVRIWEHEDMSRAAENVTALLDELDAG